jgi:hypothetical protein
MVIMRKGGFNYEKEGLFFRRSVALFSGSHQAENEEQDKEQFLSEEQRFQFILGLCLLIENRLCGDAEFFRYFFGGFFLEIELFEYFLAYRGQRFDVVKLQFQYAARDPFAFQIDLGFGSQVLQLFLQQVILAPLSQTTDGALPGDQVEKILKMFFAFDILTGFPELQNTLLQDIFRILFIFNDLKDKMVDPLMIFPVKIFQGLLLSLLQTGDPILAPVRHVDVAIARHGFVLGSGLL